MHRIRPVYSWSLRLIPVGLAAVGWHVARWVGLAAGLAVGVPTAIALWLVVYYLAFSAHLRRQHRAMASLSTDQLREIASNPMSRDLGFAMGELDKRGIDDARPSLQSLSALLTSPNGNIRGLGMSLLFGLYPVAFAKIGEGASSTDSPDVWRGRLAALMDGG